MIACCVQCMRFGSVSHINLLKATYIFTVSVWRQKTPIPARYMEWECAETKTVRHLALPRPQFGRHSDTNRQSFTVWKLFKLIVIVFITPCEVKNGKEFDP